MTLDPKIREAVESAAATEGQTPAFAKKIVAWLEELTSGNDRLDDNDSVRRHLDLIYEAVKDKSN